MSLWHRIFGSPEQQTQKMTGRARSEEAEQDEGVERQLVEPHIRVDEVAEESTSVSEVDFVPVEPEEPPAEPPADDGGETRRRRPRRRRRGRGERKTSEEGRGGGRQAGKDTKRAGGASRPAREPDKRDQDAFDDLDFDDEADKELLVEEEVDGNEDASATDEVEAKATSGRAVPPSHRNIPTWQEAIGMIVETNLGDRTERKRSPRSSTRAGSHRGRPRGRRKKKT